MALNRIKQMFIKEVQRNLLLTEIEKKYWLQNAARMPNSLLDFFYQYLKKQNNLIDLYIKKAISDHPELVAELKAKTKKIHSALAGMRRAEDEKAAETLLEEQIKQI
jgi:hypothetical protein